MSRASARLLFAVVAGLIAAPLATSQTPAKVTVTVHNVVGNNGVVRGQLCSDPAAFPNSCGVIRAETPAKEGSIDLVFTGVAPGTYGLILYHDIDGDGRFTIFSEPMAAGNESRALPPEFAAASFKVTGDLKTATTLFNALQ
jgi:uncharacterized protein (DUF2141 family)